MPSLTQGPVLPGAEAAAAETWVRSRRAGMLDFLADLIRTPSPDPPGDTDAAADLAESELRRHGIDLERFDVQGPSDSRSPTVLGWLGPRTDHPALVVNAHLDTAPPGDGWTEDPWGATRRETMIMGRGAVLSKGDVAAFIYAAAAAHAVAPDPEATVLVAITADEGAGGDLGPRHLLTQRGLRPSRAICGGVTHQVSIAHNGCVQARVRLRGQALHTALVSPAKETLRHVVKLAERALSLDQRLRKRHCALPGIDHPTLSVTRIEAGRFFGLAPGVAELWLDRRVTPEEDLNEAAEELRALVDEFATDAEVRAEYELVQVAQPLLPSPAQERWARVVAREASAVLGHAVPFGGLPLYTDARWFGAHDIPTVLYGAGPPDLASSGINGADEHVMEADVLAAASVLARVICRSLRAEAKYDLAVRTGSPQGGQEDEE